MRAAKVQASLRIRAVSPDPSLLAHKSSELRGTFRQKARSLAPLNGWACVVKICHDGMLEDTNSLDGAHLLIYENITRFVYNVYKLVNPFYCRDDLLHHTGPRQANLVLIAYASSEGSGEPAHPRSLARTSAARSYKQ